LKKKLPWIDFILYGGLAFLMLVVSIVLLIVGIPLPALIALILTTLGFIIVFLLFFFRWYNSRPDYFTKHGTAVWKDRIGAVYKGRVEHAIDYYITKLPEIARTEKVELRERLPFMLKGASIEWSGKLISSVGLGWKVKDKAGLQSGKCIKVYWPGSIKNSALFHELHHMVDEIVFGHAPDYKHERTSWWNLIRKLKEDYEEI